MAAAQEHGATTVAHGCTGKGNDQVRFEVGIASLAPDLKCIAPVRDLALTRDKAIDYAAKNKLPIETTKKNPFSIDQNVWGRAIETGFLEDIWNAPTKDVYNYTDDPAFPPVPDELIITFERGIPVAIDGEEVTPLQAIQRAEPPRAAPRALAASTSSRTAWWASSRARSTRRPERWRSSRRTASSRTSPSSGSSRASRRLSASGGRSSSTTACGSRRSSTALDAFVESTQQHVNGEMRLVLHGGRATVTGRRSDTGLYDFSLATYDEGDTFDQSAARGFIEIYGLSAKQAAAREERLRS